MTPQVGGTASPGVPQVDATASPGVGSMDVISHSGTNWDVTATLVAQYASNEWEVQGGKNMGYVHIYTTSTTTYGTGTLPLTVGEQVDIIGTSSTTTNYPGSITASKITKVSSSSTTPSSTPAPSGSGVTPLAAASFNDSVGVVAQINNGNTSWDSAWASYSPILINSGIKHIRDGFCSYGAKSSWCVNTWAPRMRQLASAGIHSDMVWDPRNCWSGCTTTTPADVYASTLGVTSEIEAYEGPNECDISAQCPWSGSKSPPSDPPYYSYNCSSFSSCMTLYIKDLWTLHSSSVQIYGPAMGHYNSTPGYSCCGNMGAYMNAGSIHDYPGANWPENNVVSTWVNAARNLSGSDPIVSTETGYNTDPTYANQGVSLLAQERYIPRLLFTSLQQGVMRSYLFELYDGGAAGSGFQYGLLTQSYAPKPAFTRLKQLLSYFSDSGTVARTPLAYSLSGDTTGKLHQLLFQHSDGSYILVPWLATQLWNSSTHTDLSPTRETLTLSLPASVSSITVTQFADHGVETTSTITGSNGKFSLPVSSLIEGVKFHT